MSERIRATGLNSGLDTDSIVKQLCQKYQTKVDNAVKEQKAIEYKQKIWKETNSKIYSFYSKSLSNMRWSTSYSKMKTESSSSALTVEAGEGAATGVQSAKILATAKSGAITSAKISKDANGDARTANGLVTDLGLSAGTYQFNGKEITIEDTTTISGLVSQLKSAGVNASFDVNQQRFYISATKSGKENDIDLSSSSTSAELLNAIGMGTQYEVDEKGNYYQNGTQITDSTTIEAIKKGNHAVRVVGADAELLLNGITYTSDSNTFSINGLTLTVNNMSDEDISITTKKDNSGIYDMIKDFIKGYNELMTEMSKLYGADKENYEPLTEDEAAALTDAEREKWEDKLNETALSGDSRLNEISSMLRTIMSQGVTMSDGSKMYLSDFGIGTLGYFESEENERACLHIDGNADDEKTAGYTDKLQSLISTDPDKVQEFFTNLSNTMYKKLTSEMSSTKMRSIYKIYNDKQMDTEHKSYDTKIDKLKEQLSKMEDKYYDQFAKMEKAMTKINSKQSTLSQYLG